MRPGGSALSGDSRQMTRRFLLSGAARGAGAATLAACGAAPKTPAAAEAPQEETKTAVAPTTAAPTVVSALMVLRGQNAAWLNSWQTIFADFEAKRPEYTLEINDSTFGAVTSRAVTFMAAGFTFDAIYGHVDWLGLFVDAGIIQAVNRFLAQDTEVSPADFHEAGILRFKGLAYGLAWRLTAHPIWSNDDTFSEAGLKTPAALEAAGNWTWEAALDAAIRLTKRESAEIAFGGLQIYPMLTSHLPYYAWAWGADLWNDGCTQAGFHTPAFADAVQFCVDLFATHRVIGGDFLAGTLGMVERATGGVREFQERIAARGVFQIGMAGRPQGPNGERATAMTPSGIFIGERAQNAAGAWEFIKYTVSADALPQIAAVGQGRFNANKKLAPLTLYPFENPAVYKRMAREGRPAPRLLQQADFTTAWRATWDAMVEGSLTVAAGMARTQEQAQGWIEAGGCLR